MSDQQLSSGIAIIESFLTKDGDFNIALNKLKEDELSSLKDTLDALTKEGLVEYKRSTTTQPKTIALGLSPYENVPSFEGVVNKARFEELLHKNKMRHIHLERDGHENRVIIYSTDRKQIGVIPFGDQVGAHEAVLDNIGKTVTKDMIIAKNGGRKLGRSLPKIFNSRPEHSSILKYFLSLSDDKVTLRTTALIHQDDYDKILHFFKK